MFVLNAKLCSIGVNFEGIWMFELGFFICFLFFFRLKKSGLIFKSPVATLRTAHWKLTPCDLYE